MHTTKNLFAECLKKHSAKTYFAVCQKIALDKDVFCHVFLFAECIFLAIGKHDLCRVSDKIHSAKPPALDKVPVSGSDGTKIRSSSRKNYQYLSCTYAVRSGEIEVVGSLSIVLTAYAGQFCCPKHQLNLAVVKILYSFHFKLKIV